MTATASLSAPQHHNTMQVVEKKPKRSIFQDWKWRKQKTARLTSKECIPHPWEETTKKNAAALRPSSTNQAVSLWRALPASRRPHLLPLEALTSNPKESSGSAACLEGKKSSSSSLPLRHKTRLCAFLKNMNAAVLSLSDKVFLCPGLPASRKARVQSTLARCLSWLWHFSSGSPTCSFVCHTFHPRLTCASLWLISDLPLVSTIKLALQLCEAEQDLPAEVPSSLMTCLTTM